MFTIYTTLSTSPNLRYVRRFALLLLAVILLVFVGSVLLFTRPNGDGRSVSAPALVIAYLVVVALLLLPLPIVVGRRAVRLFQLAKRGSNLRPFAAYLLPNVREFIDQWGLRKSNSLDQSVIVTQVDGILSLWSAGGPVGVMCEIAVKKIKAVSESRVDGYRCLVIAFDDRDDLELVLCGRVFGIDQRSVPRLVEQLNASRAANKGAAGRK